MGRTSSTARRSVGLVMVVGLLGAACGSSGDVDVSGPDDTASTTVTSTTTGPADTVTPDTGPSSTTTGRSWEKAMPFNRTTPPPGTGTSPV